MLVFFMPDTWRRSEQNNKADALPPERIRFFAVSGSLRLFPQERHAAQHDDPAQQGKACTGLPEGIADGTHQRTCGAS